VECVLTRVDANSSDGDSECRIGFVDLAVLYLEFLLFLDKGTIAYLRRR